MEAECRHERVEVRKRQHSDGSTHVVEQCLACGKQTRAVPKVKWIRDGIMPSRLPEWQEEVRQDYWKRRRVEWEENYKREQAGKNAEWWAWYNRYLESPQWKALRVKVLRRDKFVCQGCGTAGATQVHHLTYKRVGREMLFDLVSVCDTCHDSIHAAEEADECR